MKSARRIKKTANEIKNKESVAESDDGITFPSLLLSGFAARKRRYPTINGAKTVITYGKACHKRKSGMKNIIKSIQSDRSVLSEIRKIILAKKNRKSVCSFYFTHLMSDLITFQEMSSLFYIRR